MHFLSFMCLNRSRSHGLMAAVAPDSDPTTKSDGHLNFNLTSFLIYRKGQGMLLSAQVCT